MMEIQPDSLPFREVYKLMTASIVPRPIAWVSTVDAEGRNNLAPFSFFNAVCSNPPTVLFCTSVRSTDNGRKDTYHNVQATGEFVINVVTEDVAEAMNLTATEVPPDVNEFEMAGLTPVPSRLVKPPRVAESPIQFECTLNQVLTISEEPGGGSIIIGTVVMMHFDASVYREGNYIDFDAYKAVGRLTGQGYSRTRDRFDLTRPPSQVKPKDG